MATPPIAEKRPHSETYHGIIIEDPYHWLKDQSYPNVDDEDVLNYLRDENKYFESYIEPLSGLVDDLYEEMKARQQPDESSVPQRDGHYFYQSRYVEGSQYRQHIRWRANDSIDINENPVAPAKGTEILIDENLLAEPHDYFRLGAYSISPDENLLAYSTDTNGSERFTLEIKDLSTGKLLEDSIEKVSGNPVWWSDSSGFLYVVVNDQWRPYQVRMHLSGTPVEDDIIIYDEHDEGFFVDLDRSTSRQYALISTGDHVTSEVRYLSLGAVDSEARLIEPRRQDHEYHVDHQPGRFVIRTNDQHKNFQVVVAEDQHPGRENWKTLLEGTNERYITGVSGFDNRIVLSARENGLDQILLINSQGKLDSIEFPEQAYNAYPGSNPESNPAQLRIGYSSLVTPDTVYDYDFDSTKLIVRKVRVIPSGYDSDSYKTERRMVQVRDGTLVPVTIVYRRETSLDGSAPLYLYGYGAYGASMDPSFGTVRISLLDRGFVYAIAHIRGGSEMGYHWYEAGKLSRRTNTFNDFVDVAKYLIDEKYTRQGRIAIAGGSAGGSLMGAAINQAPELWGAVVAHVPFVDILNTMLDTSLPLTPMEWPEWGNPIEDAKAFEYIQSYSPYDQLIEGEYPPIYVTAGLNDPRVTYWEPAKFVAKLRTLKKDANVLLLNTEMGAGHGGKSGRLESLRESAKEYAFILHSMGTWGRSKVPE